MRMNQWPEVSFQMLVRMARMCCSIKPVCIVIFTSVQYMNAVNRGDCYKQKSDDFIVMFHDNATTFNDWDYFP